jgi:hypothetical protein
VTVKYDGNGTTISGEVTPAARLPDDGRDLGQELRNMGAAIADVQGALDSQIFDPRTGAPSPRLTGRDREAAEMMRDQARANRMYSELRFAEIELQRARDLAWRQAEQEERATRAAFTGGDARRDAAYADALLRAEADTAAQAAMARRFEKGRG